MGFSSPDMSVSLSVMPEKIQGRSQQGSKAHTWHAYERTIKMLSTDHLSLSLLGFFCGCTHPLPPKNIRKAA